MLANSAWEHLEILVYCTSRYRTGVSIICLPIRECLRIFKYSSFPRKLGFCARNHTGEHYKSFFNFFGNVAWHLSSPTRGWTQAMAVKAPNPNHWTTREFPLFITEDKTLDKTSVDKSSNLLQMATLTLLEYFHPFSRWTEIPGCHLLFLWFLSVQLSKRNKKINWLSCSRETTTLGSNFCHLQAGEEKHLLQGGDYVTHPGSCLKRSLLGKENFPIH